jgi:DNA-binding response OmpR family regulator
MQPMPLVLLVETEQSAMEILFKMIQMRFPGIELHSATTLEGTINLVQDNRYDLIVCDAFLATNARINFVRDICFNGSAQVIVIIGDTAVTQGSFPTGIGENYIHDVIHKPVDYNVLFASIECAIQRIKARKAP